MLIRICKSVSHQNSTASLPTPQDPQISQTENMLALSIVLNVMDFVPMTGNINSCTNFWHVAVVSQAETSTTGLYSCNCCCYNGMDTGIDFNISNGNKVKYM
jgi:hypothetical protein